MIYLFPLIIMKYIEMNRVYTYIARNSHSPLKQILIKQLNIDQRENESLRTSRIFQFLLIII